MAKITGIHTPAVANNLAINGGFDFWQRVAGNTTTVNTATTSFGYPSDRFNYVSIGSTVKNYSVVRSTDVPSFAASGFQSSYSHLFTCLTAIAAPAATDVVKHLGHKIEGTNYQQIHGKTFTLSFWVKASKAGTFPVAFSNSASNRSYVTSYTISGANTWELKTLTVPTDTVGTWLFDTGVGMSIDFACAVGSNYLAPSLNTWNAGSYFGFAGLTNIMDTTNATIQFAQISVVEGTLFQGFRRAGLDEGGELAKCQRYYSKSYAIETVPGTTGTGDEVRYRAAATTFIYTQQWKVSMRTGPTVTYINPNTGATGQIRDISGSADKAVTNENSPNHDHACMFASGVVVGNTLGWHFTVDAEL